MSPEDILSPTDTTRILVLTSPVKTATGLDHANESVLPSYKKLEDGVYASQLLGALDQSVTDFINNGNFTGASTGPKAVIIPHRISIDTLTNNQNITSISLALQNQESDMRKYNDLTAIKDLNPTTIMFLYHGSEREQATVGEAT